MELVGSDFISSGAISGPTSKAEFELWPAPTATFRAAPNQPAVVVVVAPLADDRYFVVAHLHVTGKFRLGDLKINR